MTSVPMLSAPITSSRIILIAALVASSRVIGNAGKLPWHIPEDLQRFKRLTSGHAIIMGRKTWELGLNKKALPNRLNLVVTGSPQRYQQHPSTPPGLSFVDSLHAALEQAQCHSKVFIIGGASVYAQTLNWADGLELTLIESHYDGDARFPEWEHLVGDRFCLIAQDHHPGYRFERYIKCSDLPAASPYTR